MTTSYYKKGESIDYTNAGSAISSGDVVVMGNLVGVAEADIAASTGVGPVGIDGVYLLTKVAGTAWVIGDHIYYDSGNEYFTKTAGGNTFAGYAALAATSAATTGYVKLAGRQPSPNTVMTAQGDVVTGDSNGDAQALALGAAGKVLQSDGTDAVWSTVKWATADGSSGQFLQTNGSGVTSFAAAAYAEKSATLSISSAQLLALDGANGGDLEVVAAQADVIYVPTMMQIWADYDTAEYTAGDDCVLVLGTAAAGTVVANVDKTAFIPGTTADQQVFMSMLDTALWAASATTKGIDISSLANTALSFNVKSGGTQFTDPGTAAGVFKIKVWYREMALLTA